MTNMKKSKIIKASLTLLCAICCGTNGFAQINLSIKGQTIRQIIPQVEKVSGYSIFYTNELPDLDTKKDLKLSNTSLKTILQELFKDTKIAFEIKEDKQVLLFQQLPKQEKKNN